MASSDNGDDGAQVGKPEIDHDKEINSVKIIETFSTLTDKNFKALRSEIHVFVETHSDECEKTPRSFKKQPWIGLVDRFVESDGKGDKFWAPTRDEYNDATHLSWPNDREDIRFLVFCLLKKEASTKAKKQRASNAAELGGNDDNEAAASPATPARSSKKRKDNAAAGSPASPLAKKSRKNAKLPKAEGVATASDQDPVDSEEEGSTIEVKDPRDAPDFLGPARAQHEKQQVKAATAKPASSAKPGQGQSKGNAKESVTDSTASKNQKSGSTPRALSNADIENSKFISTKSGVDPSIGAKGTSTSKKRGADGEASKNIPPAKDAAGAKKLKVDNDGQKAAVTGKMASTTPKEKKEDKSTTKASPPKKLKTGDQVEPTKTSSITQIGHGRKTDAEMGVVVTKPSSTDKEDGDAGGSAVVPKPKPKPMLQTNFNSFQAKPKADDGHVGDKPMPTAESVTTTATPSIFGPEPAAIAPPIVGGKADGLLEDQVLTINNATEQNLVNVQGGQATTVEIDHRTSPALLSNPTPVRDISDEFSSTDFCHNGIKLSQETASTSQRAAALASVEPFELVAEENGEVVDETAHRKTLSERESTREKSMGQEQTTKGGENGRHTQGAALSLISPVNTMGSPVNAPWSPTLPATSEMMPTIIFVINIETPSYQMPSSQMLTFPLNIDWATFYGALALELTGMDKHAIMDAQSVKVNYAALTRPNTFKMNAEAGVFWKRLMKKIAAAEEEEVEVCFQ